MQIPGSRHLGGQHGLVILPATGEQIPPARYARRMDDTLHGADLAPNSGKGGLYLCGVCNVTAVGSKGYAGQHVGQGLTAAVQQHHARAAVLVNLPCKGLAHAAKTAGNHHATLVASNGCGGGRSGQTGKLANPHRAIGSHHIRPVNAAKAGCQSRRTGRRFKLHIGAGNPGFFPRQAKQRALMQGRAQRTLHMPRHKCSPAHHRNPQAMAQTAPADFLQQGAKRPRGILPASLRIRQAEQMVNVGVQNFIGKGAGVVCLHRPDTPRDNLRAKSLLQACRKLTALPAKQQNLFRFRRLGLHGGVFPVNAVQLWPWRLRAGRTLTQNHEHHAPELHKRPARGINHRAVCRDHALLPLGNAHQRPGLRGQGAVQPHLLAARRHKTGGMAQGEAGGNVHHGRMPAEGIEIPTVGIGQAQFGQQGIAVRGNPKTLAALPALADAEPQLGLPRLGLVRVFCFQLLSFCQVITERRQIELRRSQGK